MTKEDIVAAVAKALKAAEVTAEIEAQGDGGDFITVEVGYHVYVCYDCDAPEAGFEWGVVSHNPGSRWEPPESDYASKGTSMKLREAVDQLVPLLVELRLAEARVGEFEDELADEQERSAAEPPEAPPAGLYLYRRYAQPSQ